MPISLTDQDISATYKGLIHSQGLPIPSIGQTRLYDGNGSATAVSIGVNNNGATVRGALTVTDSMSVPALTATTNITAPNAAKAWVCFKGSSIGGDKEILSSHNISRVSKSGINNDEIYTVIFAADTVKDANYCYQLSYTTDKSAIINKIAFAFVDSNVPPSKNSINLCFRLSNLASTSPFDPVTASLTIYNT